MTEPLVHCARCQREAPPVTALTYPGPLGEEIARRVCGDCWAEWRRAEVMVINELRLDFMDPAAQDVLISHMRDFLGLAEPGPTD